MAAPLGWKDFASGDVLTAADMDGYVMAQIIAVFADATARDASITSPQEGQHAWLKSDDSLYYVNAAGAWIASPVGDITGITTASLSGMAGGAASGTASISVDASNLTSVTGTTADYVVIQDVDDSDNTKKCLISDFVAVGDITSIVTGAASGLSGGATSGAVTLILNLAGLTAAQAFGADGSGVDVTFHSDTAGDYALWDSSEEKLILEGTNGATVLDITDGNVVIGDGTLTVGSDGAGEDVTFHSDTAGDAFAWDSSAEKLTITGTDGATALDIPDGNVTITDALTVTGITQTYLSVLTDSTTTRAPALTDASAYILCTHGSGMTVTLPQDSVVAFPTGSHIVFERNGAGTLTFAAGTGATVNSKGGTLTCADRYTTIAAVKIAADTWTIFGNIG